MKTLKNLFDWLKYRSKDWRKAGVDASCGSEINKPSSVQEAIRYRKRANDAAEVLRQIDCKCEGASDERLLEIQQMAVAGRRAALGVE